MAYLADIQTKSTRPRVRYPHDRIATTIIDLTGSQSLLSINIRHTKRNPVNVSQVVLRRVEKVLQYHSRVLRAWRRQLTPPVTRHLLRAVLSHPLAVPDENLLTTLHTTDITTTVRPYLHAFGKT